MKKSLIILGLLSLIGASVRAETTAPAAPLSADRWLEVDVYWFDRGNIEKSCHEFWERFTPLFEGVNGWHGVILNVGWTPDYVVDWSGDLNQRIPRPAGIRTDPWVKLEGVLSGTSDERINKWKERFAHPTERLKRGFEPWTYGDLKTLVASLRRVAEKEHGLAPMRVGALSLGWRTIYNGVSPWALRHPEAFEGDWKLLSAVRLHADPTPLAAFPKGLPQGTPYYKLFGKQWGSMSKAVGLDAIVLRDSMVVQVQYKRDQLIPSPERARLLHEGSLGMVRETKKANPDALVLGYSNGASAISDWRCNGVDLEAIAKEGYLDAWIDQTWAGAWNEVGVRHDDFWNCPYLGWTYQLAYMLVHSAILADTKVHHYPLVETFDAWESWDILGTVPERLKWGIWAYSHAAVKTPQGLQMPKGTYISWGNSGPDLLDSNKVSFLAKEVNSAVRDALATTSVCGPTLVYCRDAQAWQAAHAPEKDTKAWLDEQIGTVAKWSVPISSITRLEYLPAVKSDLFIVGTPVHLKSAQRKTLVDMIEHGQPAMLVGSPDGGVDSELLKLAGVKPQGPAQAEKRTRARLAGAGDLAAGLPAEFEIIQHPFVPSQASAASRILYTIDNSPGLTLNTNGGRKLLFWDPPEMISRQGRPMIENLGGVEAYVLAARALTSLLPGSEAPWAAEIDPRQPVAILAWQGQGGVFNLLAGNLEEGLNLNIVKSRNAAFPQWDMEKIRANRVPTGLDDFVKEDRSLTLNLPTAWKTDHNPVDIELPRSGSVRLEFGKP